jgi:hypothetical protein
MCRCGDVCFSLYRITTLIQREKYGRFSPNRPMFLINEHRYNSYYRSPYSPIWRWRRLLVFATEVNRKAPETQTVFIPHLSEWLVRYGLRTLLQMYIRWSAYCAGLPRNRICLDNYSPPDRLGTSRRTFVKLLLCNTRNASAWWGQLMIDPMVMIIRLKYDLKSTKRNSIPIGARRIS